MCLLYWNIHFVQRKENLVTEQAVANFRYLSTWTKIVDRKHCSVTVLLASVIISRMGYNIRREHPIIDALFPFPIYF